MVSQPKLLFVCILLKSIHLSQGIWEPPYFSAPPNSSIIVINVESQSTDIEFNEEIKPPFVIADFNYFGDSKPTITNIDGDGNNSTLGIITQQQTSTNQWELVVTIKQDYESGIHQYHFTVVVDQVKVYVVIAVKNIHDNAPIILSEAKTCYVNESFVGLSSCMFEIEDVDGDVTNLTLNVDAGGVSSKDVFSLKTINIESNHMLTTALNIDKALDYETQDLYSLTITAKCTLADPPLESSTTIIVQVNDLPDEPPKWITFPPVVTINEKSKYSFQVKAIDGDTGINANISYSILKVSENLTSYVNIDGNSGKITIKAIDRDVKNVNSFEITILAYETLDATSNISAVITVMVKDLDDHIPEILPAFLNETILERRSTSLQTQIQIKDPDLGENGSFNVELISTSEYKWNEAFEVVPSFGYQSLLVTVSTTNYSLLDYNQENWRSITLQIVAKEVANSSHIGKAVLQIQLKPVNDRYPEFLNLPYVINVKETIGKGELVLNVSAIDEDFGDKVTYKMNSSVLQVDSLGRVTIAEDDAFDYERQKMVQEVVQAVDLANHVTYTQITVNVIDVDDTPPTLTLPLELLKVKENSVKGTVITHNITGTDPDTNASLVFSLNWTLAGATKQGVAFNVSLLTGCLAINTHYKSAGKWKGEMIVNDDVLDYEKFDTLYVTVVVKDINTEVNDDERSAIVTIEIEDVNDNPPVFDRIPNLSIEENSNTGKLIGTITAKDADGPGFNNVSFSLVNVNPTPVDLVKIDKITGEITVFKDKGIDCEQIQILEYNVTATDGELSSNILINITVIDMNDNSPNITSPNISNYQVTIDEESKSGTFIYEIVATDADFSEPYHNITYLINYQSYPYLEDYFYIEPYTGKLLVELKGKKRLDRDAGVGSYTIYLILRDNFEQYSLINSNHVEEVLTVVLRDMNDNPPVFPNITGFLFSVNETVKKGALLLDSLQAVDIDEGDNAKVTYSIVNITAESDVLNLPNQTIFNITTVNYTYAQIYAADDLEGFFGTYTIFLQAEDHGTPSNIVLKKYQVYINDVNDHAPVFQFPSLSNQIYIQEIQTVGSNVLDRYGKELPPILATDADAGENAHIKYMLLGSDDALKYFVTSSGTYNTAILSVMRSFDKESITSIQLTLEAKDNGSPPLSTNLTTTLLIITNVEQEPQFIQPTWTTQFTENITGLSEEVTIPAAIDRNNINKPKEEYQMIYYFIVGDANNELFQLNSTTGKLHLRQQIDREVTPQIYLTIVATNNASRPPQSPQNSSLLIITINVQDVNDSPPVFQQYMYSGGIRASDNIDKVILTLNATDPDLNDSISFSLGSAIAVSDSSLNSYSKNGITVSGSGQVILNFKPQNSAKGYFYFNVTATDLANHTDSAYVQVYLISTSNLVNFIFLNTFEFVETRRNQIENIFTSVFGYKSFIDSVTKAVDENQQAIPNRTEVLVLFIDTSKDLPVDGEDIKQQTENIAIITKLRAQLYGEVSLELEDLKAETDSHTLQTNTSQLWIYIIVALVLMTALWVALLGLYFWRTKSLQNRLDKMAAATIAEARNDTIKNATLSTANLFEHKINPVHGISKPVYVTGEEEMNTYIDEALHGLENKIDLSSKPE